MNGMPRTLAVIHNNIDGRSSIGLLARWAVDSALARGWQVIAVCRDLDPRLAGAVDHRPLYVPPRAHLLQWSVARPTVRAALRGRRPDAVLTYQAQIASIADVWHVAYLSRPVRRAGIPRGPGLRALVRDGQAAGVGLLEDRYLHRLSDRPMVLFSSDGLRRDFEAIYGTRARAGVLYDPALLDRAPVDPSSRTAARTKLVGGHDGPVVGFLGGADPRKGGDRVVAGVAADERLFLLHAGPQPLPVDDPRLQGRERGLGHLGDVTELLDAVDVLAVPSRYEPFGLVVAEAASRGVPVLVDPGVGAAPLVTRAGAGELWPPGAALGPLVDRLGADRPRYQRGAQTLLAELDPDRLADQLFVHLDRSASRNRARR